MTGSRDAAHEVWTAAIGRSADIAARQRAVDCLLIGLAEVARSAGDEHFSAVARGLVEGPGACTAAGVWQVSPTSAIAANSYLMHADLADDAYALALHPGSVVIPAALAAVQQAGGDGKTLIAAIVVGYEVAGLLADAFLPEASLRGWRITAVLGQMAAAATSCVGLGRAEFGQNALRVAASGSGGVLETVKGMGTDWQWQPASASVGGWWAAKAAYAGVQGSVGSIGGSQGLHHLTTGRSWPGVMPKNSPRITEVTFKRFSGATYVQPILAAITESPPIEGVVRSVKLRVNPFVASYANQPEEKAQRGVASVRESTETALRRHCPELDITTAAFNVMSDDSLDPLKAELILTLEDGRDVRLPGDVTALSWSREMVLTHCESRTRSTVRALLDCAVQLEEAPSTERLFAAWHELVDDVGDHGV